MAHGKAVKNRISWCNISYNKPCGIIPDEILKARSKHKEARKVLIELIYRLCLENKTLRELEKELGGISGAGLARVHERLQEKISKDKSLNEKIMRLAESFCQ